MGRHQRGPKETIKRQLDVKLSFLFLRKTPISFYGSGVSGCFIRATIV
jgi:hypothetical protein